MTSYQRGLVAEEERLVLQLVGEHLEVVPAHVLDLLRLVNAQTDRLHRLGLLKHGQTASVCPLLNTGKQRQLSDF